MIHSELLQKYSCKCSSIRFSSPGPPTAKLWSLLPERPLNQSNEVHHFKFQTPSLHPVRRHNQLSLHQVAFDSARWDWVCLSPLTGAKFPEYTGFCPWDVSVCLAIPRCAVELRTPVSSIITNLSVKLNSYTSGDISPSPPPPSPLKLTVTGTNTQDHCLPIANIRRIVVCRSETQ